MVMALNHKVQKFQWSLAKFTYQTFMTGLMQPITKHTISKKMGLSYILPLPNLVLQHTYALYVQHYKDIYNLPYHTSIIIFQILHIEKKPKLYYFHSIILSHNIFFILASVLYISKGWMDMCIPLVSKYIRYQKIIKN